MSASARDEGNERASKNDLGRWGEQLAARYLERRGHRVVEANARTRDGEIDLITVDHGTLVFVEVKLRHPGRLGPAVEAITPAKQRRLRELSARYAADHPELPVQQRIDLVAIDLRADGTLNGVQHIESAIED